MLPREFSTVPQTHNPVGATGQVVQVLFDLGNAWPLNKFVTQFCAPSHWHPGGPGPVRQIYTQNLYGLVFAHSMHT